MNPSIHYSWSFSWILTDLMLTGGGIYICRNKVRALNRWMVNIIILNIKNEFSSYHFSLSGKVTSFFFVLVNWIEKLWDRNLSSIWEKIKINKVIWNCCRIIILCFKRYISSLSRSIPISQPNYEIQSENESINLINVC